MKSQLNRFGPIVIIVSAALVTIPRLAAAFAMVEPGFMGLETAWITGPGYGVLAMIAAAYSLQVYQDRKKLALARWILIGWGTILALASLILLPGMVVEVRQSKLATVLPFPLDVLWCALLAVSPEIIIGIAALAFALSKDKAAKKPATPTKSQATQFPCQHCDYVAKSQAGLNAHQRKHKTQGASHAELYTTLPTEEERNG